MALSFSGGYPSSFALFSTNFHEPNIPTAATELRGHFLQHKWNAEVSHISSGYWYNSAANGKVRIDETYEGAYGSSIFDYTDMSSDGGVMNHQVLVGPSVGSESTCFDDYVQNPGFPLITPGFLKDWNASFGGVVNEPFLGVTQTWNLLFAGSIPVIAYLNDATEPMLLGYDFWAPDERTKVVTRFYAQSAGKEIDKKVFADFPCPKKGSGKADLKP